MWLEYTLEDFRREGEITAPCSRDGESKTSKSAGTGDPLSGNIYTEGMERNEYVEQRNGGFYVAGTRVSLDSIVYSFKTGDSPETIRQNFSSLTLEQVYGAIAFYLAHKQKVDANISEGEEELNRSVPPLSESRPELHARLERARHEMSTQDLAKH